MGDAGHKHHRVLAIIIRIMLFVVLAALIAILAWGFVRDTIGWAAEGALERVPRGRPAVSPRVTVCSLPFCLAADLNSGQQPPRNGFV
jgi:hypothetical protein